MSYFYFSRQDAGLLTAVSASELVGKTAVLTQDRLAEVNYPIE